LFATRIAKLYPGAIDQRAINEAAELLERGGLVVFPTETVYGIAANLLNKQALGRLKKIKDRPQDKEFSIHIGDKRDIEKYAVDVLPRAYKVLERFWPGPLTVVLPAPHGKSVGLRMPKNNIAFRLLNRCDFPVIAPSANLAGHPAPRTAEDAFSELNGLIELVLDGGPTELGTESTVLDARRLPFTVLRDGVLKKEEILKVASRKEVLFVCTGNSCRSVMAEYLLRKKLMDAGRDDVDVSSAGTFAFFGMSPTRETLKLVQETGLDAAGHRAQRASADVLKQADIILVMENRHKEDVLRQCPRCKDRVHVLGELAGLGQHDIEVPDPIGKSEEFYRMSFEKIKEAIRRLEI